MSNTVACILQCLRATSGRIKLKSVAYGSVKMKHAFLQRRRMHVTGVNEKLLMMEGVMFKMFVVKGFLAIILIFGMVGCAGLQLQDTEYLAKVAIHAASSNLGYWVATEQPQLHGGISASYWFLRSGQVPPEDLAKALQEVRDKKPLLALNLTNVLRAMGAVFTADGILIDKIPEAYWLEAEIGYKTGFVMGGGVLDAEQT